jgi:hypothetical protein
MTVPSRPVAYSQTPVAATVDREATPPRPGR